MRIKILPDNNVIQIFVFYVVVVWMPYLYFVSHFCLLSLQLPTVTSTYVAYCCNQLAAKVLLDEKRQDKKVADFLERCQESPFSRKLDLWSFLDVPRSRLVKYPLLLKNILRLTPNDHEDRTYLMEAVSVQILNLFYNGS